MRLVLIRLVALAATLWAVVVAAPAADGADPRWTSVETATDATCATDQVGTAWCWGSNVDGLLGTTVPIGDHRSLPVRIRGVPRIRQLSAVGGHACAVDRAGRIWCWGQRFLESGDDEPAPRPAVVAGLTHVREVRAGQTTDCAKRPDGVWCWAGGEDSFAPRRVTPQTRGRLRVSDSLACLVRQGKGADCWTLPSRDERSVRLRVRTRAIVDLSLAPIDDEESGIASVCLLTPAGRVRCTTDSGYEALISHASFEDAVAARFPGATRLVRVEGSICVLQRGRLKCVSRGPTAYEPAGAGSSEIVAVAASYPSAASAGAGGDTGHLCVLNRAGKIRCLGQNGQGQLGRGQGQIPAPITGLADTPQIVAGAQHACSRSSAGVVACWGAGGTLGDGTTEPSAVPVAVALPGRATALSSADDLTCAVVDQFPWCWGTGESGAGASWSRAPSKLDRLGPVDRLSVGVRGVCGSAAGSPPRCVRPSRALDGVDQLVWRAPSAPFGARSVGAFAVVGSDVCGAVDGGVECHVIPGVGAPSTTPDLRRRYDVGGVQAITGSIASGCLSGTGDVQCWGFDGISYDSHGPQEDDTDDLRRPFGGSVGWAVSSGHYVACGIAPIDGVVGPVRCAGFSRGGNNPAPASLLGGSIPARSVAVGDLFACAIDAARRVQCWGSGTHGELGRGTDGGFSDALLPVSPPLR